MDIVKYAVIAALVYILVVIIFFLVQERFIFQGRQINLDYQYDFDFDFEEVFLNPDTETQLHGLLIKSPKPSKGVILYFHGNRGDLRKWGPITSKLTKYEYDVFVVDYRGYGKSRGERSELTLHEDAQFVYDYLDEKYPNKVLIYGRSLGSGIAVRLASQRASKLLVLETPYYSLVDLAKRYAVILPLNLLSKYEFRSHLYLNKVKGAVAIFHGTEDYVVPIESALKLVDTSNKANVNFIKISGGKHNNLDTFEVYQSELERVIGVLN